MPEKSFAKYGKNIYKASCIILFLFSSFVLIKSVRSHYKFISQPYQLEYREGAALNITNLFLNDRNPFSIGEQPQNTYVFGFFYPLAVTPVAGLFGNTLPVHRSFVYFFILATCLVIFCVLLRKKVNIAFAFAAMVILHQTVIIAANTPIARPEGLGIFLYVLGIIIPWRFNFSNVSLAASIALGVLAYLTKPYYVLLIPILAIYVFIFVDKKKSVIYSVVSFFSLLAAFAITSLIFPMYLNNTIVYHIADSVYSFSYMTEQLLEYAEFNIFLIIIILTSGIIMFRKLRKCRVTEGSELKLDYPEVELPSKFSFRNYLEKPLIKSRFDLLFLFSFFISLILFAVSLGGHTGNWQAAYLVHLGSPFLILVTFVLLEKTSSKYNKSFAALLLILTLNFQFVIPKYDFDRFSMCYKQMEELIKKNNNILNSPENVSFMIQENKSVYNSGLSECFEGVNNKNGILTAATKGVSERMEEFQKEMDKKITEKEFDLILLTKGYHSFFVKDSLLKQNYYLDGVICAPYFYSIDMEVEKWIPKKNN